MTLGKFLCLTLVQLPIAILFHKHQMLSIGSDDIDNDIVSTQL